MGKREQAPKQYNVAEMAPDEIGAIKAIVTEFMSRCGSIDNEIEGLKESRKDLLDEFSGRLDVKTLQMALKVLKIQAGVQHRDTFELFLETLSDPAQ